MRRYHITLGAHTTAGGVVVSGSSRITINDAPVALEGDKIACRSCKSTGDILCTGPRHPEVFDGKPVALENDFCICGCNPPPRLIPSQSLRFQTVEGSGVAESRRPSAFQESQINHEYDQHILLVDKETGKPVDVPFEYILKGENGEVKGDTTTDGKTGIYGTHGPSEVEVVAVQMKIKI